MTDEKMLAWANAMPSDCNGNGIPDSTDIRLGYDIDVNQNGLIDYCDSDTAVIRAAHSNFAWRALAYRPDTSYFALRHERTRHVRIHYTVPRNGARVRLVILDDAGQEVDRPVDQSQAKGFYEVMWSRRVKGIALTPGLYRFRLTVANHEYVRDMSWWEY